MPPNVSDTDAIQQQKHQSRLSSDHNHNTVEKKQQSAVPKRKYKWDIVWRNVIAFVYLHTTAIYGLYLTFFVSKWQTFFFSWFVSYVAGLGITAGAHRLWAHRSYKATWPLRLFLMIGQTIAFQNHIYEWVRDHRAHHKYTDTDADPHNATRGFFFSHMGWLMVRKQPEVRKCVHSLDMDDLKSDPIVMWQKKYYIPFMLLWGFIIPICVPVFFWGEELYIAFFVSLARYTVQLNFTWLVNSAAHIWGMRPYDKTISSTQNKLVAILALGEGWHNYHHVFPWDYKTAELGSYSTNFTAGFIDICAKLGLAYDLKTVSDEHVRQRAARTGDGTHERGVWGWGDKDIAEDCLSRVEILHKKEK